MDTVTAVCGVISMSAGFTFLGILTYLLVNRWLAL